MPLTARAFDGSLRLVDFRHFADKLRQMDPLQAQHVRLLVLLHYGLAALTALGSIVSGLLMFAGHGLTEIPPSAPTEPTDFGSDELRLSGLAVLIVGACLVAICLIHAAVVVWIGWQISRRKRWGLCVGFSVCHLVFFPIGTAVSVYAIVVLRWPDVRRDFGV